MGSRLLLNLLARRHPRREQGAISAAAGIVATLVLILSGAAVVQLSSGNLRGVFASSDTRQARGAAAEGTDLMIDTWNQPQNRRLLVSGQDPAAWNAANLQSPCVDTRDGSRPGPNNGLPDQAAIDLADGNWRDVVTGGVAGDGQNGRQYRLLSISYTASDVSTNPNPRQLRRRFAVNPAGGAGPVDDPAGGGPWDALVNVNDPDGIEDLQPGRNSGFLVLEVEGRVVRGGRVVANSRETREFEVLPKCCGASLGSQGTGGANFPANTAGSLGSDSRLCNIQYGIATGFNGGWHWSFFANDRFTQRDPDTGQVGFYTPILGVIPNEGDLFQRSNCRVRPASGCARTDDPADGDDGNDNTFASTIAGGSPTPGTPPCEQSGPSGYYAGPQTDIDGTTASCTTILPFLATNFPPISDFQYAWTTGRGPDTIIQAAAAEANKTQNVFLWPRLSTDNGDDSGSANSDVVLRLRTNDEAGAERVELCIVERFGNTCADNTWLTVSDQGGAIDPSVYNVGDLPIESDDEFTAAYAQDISDLTAPYITFQAQCTSTTFFGSCSWESDDYIELQASPDDGATWYPFARLYEDDITTSSTGTRVNLALPFVSSDFQFRTRNTLDSGSFFGGDETGELSNITIQSGQPGFAIGDNNNPSGLRIDTAFRGTWCEYTGTSPVSGTPGFHCLGPTFDQWDSGRIFIDTSGGPLTFYYTEAENVDRRAGANTTQTDAAIQENFLYLSRSSSGQPAELAHVDCGAIQDDCDVPVSETEFAPVGQPDRLNFFGRDSGTDGNEQNIRINTTFGTDAKIAGVWFYLPQGRVELRVTGGAANDVPDNFYTDDDAWSFSGRIWAKQFKPYGAFHLRVPPSAPPGAALGQASASSFVPWQGFDWVARAVTNTRLW